MINNTVSVNNIYQILLIVLVCILFIFPSSLLAQSQYAFNYQGLARDAEGDPISNQEVSIRISILKGSESGDLMFQEVHQLSTNERGLFSLAVGLGEFEMGHLQDIKWGDDVYFVLTEMDPSGGDNYNNMGAAQLYSVPYAIHSLNAENAESGGSDNQQLVLSGTVLGISNANSIDLSVLQDGNQDADADPANEIQQLVLTGSILGLTNGNSIDLSVIQDGVDDADADPTNEFQSLSFQNNQLSITNGNTVNIPLTIDTDQQTLSLSGSTLGISNGNSVNLNTLINDADADPSNEIQNLSLSGSVLSLSNSNSITLPSVGNSYWVSSGNGINYSGEFFKNENGNGSIFLSGDIGIEHKDNFGNLSSYLGRSGGIGFLQLYNYNDLAVDIASNFDGSGIFTTFHPNGFKLAEIDEYNNGGRFRLFYKSDEKMSIDSHNDVGYLDLNGQNNRGNVRLTWLSGCKNCGYVGVYDDTDEVRAGLYASSNRTGSMWVDGPSDRSNVDITYTSANHDHGYVSVNDISGNTIAAIYVDAYGFGRVYADFYDSLVEDSPTKSGKKVVYTMLQGPESAAYLRGTAMMDNGKGSVEFPGHFSNLIDEKAITVMITPLSSVSKGIAVVEKTKSGFKVEELLDGKGSYGFDWEVKGVRGTAGSQKKNRLISMPQNIIDGTPLSRTRKGHEQ